MVPFKSSIIILFLTALQHLQQISAIDLYKDQYKLCNSFCIESRPNGIKKAYKFKCDKAYAGDKNRTQECKDACEFCPKEVCDETIDDESDNKWHCPELPDNKIDGTCIAHCNKYRPWGKRESFTIDCNEAHPETDQRGRGDCKQKCEKCDDFICRVEQNHLYYCPTEKFENGPCKEECDKARPFGQVEAFDFKCNVQYSTDPAKQQTCQEACDKDPGCPVWVCDKSKANGKNEYHCPNQEVIGKCKDFCDYNRGDRDPKKGYMYDCQTGDSGSCFSSCSDCDLSGNNPNCDQNNLNTFYCPPKEPDNPPLQRVRSYKGPCMKRCENNRGGGIYKFNLDCNGDRYLTVPEKDLCKADCNTECSTRECPEEIIRCRDQKHEIEKEKKRKEEEERQKRIEKRRQEKEVKKAEERTDLVLKVVIGLGFLFLIICIGFVWYMSHKHKKNLAAQTQLVYNQASRSPQQLVIQQQAPEQETLPPTPSAEPVESEVSQTA